MKRYSPQVEETMRRFYASLNEKDRRRYAGLEALKYGHGGRAYIARVLGCSRNTVSKGAREVSGLSGREVYEQIRGDSPGTKPRVREPGGGRRPCEQTWGPSLDEKFLEVLRQHTAGDPMDEKIRWTNLTPGEIVAALREDHDIRVSQWVVFFCALRRR